MGNECNYLSACNKNQIKEMERKELRVDIESEKNNPHPTINKVSNKDISLDRMKSYFNKNRVNINLANKHKSVVVSYGIILQKILAEKHFKSIIKRRTTIRAPIEIRNIVQELLKERELEIQKEKFLHQRNQIKSDESSTNTTTNSISFLNSSQLSNSQKLSNTQIEFILKTLYEKRILPQSAVNDYRLYAYKIF